MQGGFLFSRPSADFYIIFLEVLAVLKLIIGLKGSGKTKTLIEMSNNASQNSKGSVVCIEMGSKLIYDIKPQVRLIDSDQYGITDAVSLYAFIAGILASNHDVTDLFVDSALKICGNDIPSFTDMILKLDSFADSFGFNLVITSSISREQLPEPLARFVIN